MKDAIMPHVARGLSSNTFRNLQRGARESFRKLTRRPHQLTLFLRVDDPYSALLVQVLPAFLERFDVQVRFHTVLNLDNAMFPAPALWEANALNDAAHLARLYELPYAPNEHLRDRTEVEGATATLLACESAQRDYLKNAQSVFARFWQSPSSNSPLSASLGNTTLQRRLADNEQLLRSTGHYLSAMIHYAGEWYWGLDRLDHLERRLNDLGASTEPRVEFDRTYRDFCSRRGPADLAGNKPLTLYWSARSPYSYIGLERAVQLAHFHQIPLEVKPVLPMVMRGMKVPKEKKMYIFFDTKREAEKLGLPYGYVADPVGAAVERCYSLVEYARDSGRLESFLLSFARGVNAEGIRAETDQGLKHIVERCGLSWAEACTQLHQDHWREWAENNLQEMFELGCWGVPSFHYDDLVLWGQDRIGIIDRVIAGTTEDNRTANPLITEA